MAARISRTNLTIADVVAWFQATGLRDYAPIALKERCRLWGLFCAACGHMPVAKARPAHLLAFITSQSGVRSNHTRRRLNATICAPFNLAARMGFIARNPFSGLRFPKGPDGRDWTAQEYRALLRAAAPYVRRLIVFIRFSGARPGEARTLRWEHVKQEAQAIVQTGHKTQHISRGPRRIYFNHVVVALLAWLWRNRSHKAFVFVNRRGRPWTIRALANHFAILRQRAGLSADVRCHGGRHTFATGALLRGVDIYTLAQLLGHSSVKTTERYVHLLDKREHLNAAMEKAIGS